jgi:ABC-type lipoprotein release transport system permease subunit
LPKNERREERFSFPTTAIASARPLKTSVFDRSGVSTSTRMCSSGAACECPKCSDRVLHQVHFYDPISIVLAVLVLSAPASLAGFISARRASSIDPMQALRVE